MVDIQSAAAEIRRGKTETTGQKYNVLPYYTGRPHRADPRHRRRRAGRGNKAPTAASTVKYFRTAQTVFMFMFTFLTIEW